MRKKKNLVLLYEKKIHQLVEILKKLKPEKIILFGAVAQGKISPDSDIDLCIIKKVRDRLATKQKIWDLLWKADYEWEIEPDIHVYHPEIYEDWLKREDPFIAEIEKGRTIYEK